MATQKKKSAKKPVKKKNTAVEGEQGFGLVLAGWFLLALGVILLLGCISSVYSGSHGNWLGPYLGKMIPNAVMLLFGKVSVLFFTVALALWGLCLAFDSLRGKLLRFALGLTLLSVDISCLMALKTYGFGQVSKDVLMLNGGILGQFFSQNIAMPIFGQESCIAPLIILVICLVLILVLSFGLRPRHFHFLVQGSNWLKKVFAKKPVIEAEVVELDDSDRTGRDDRTVRDDRSVSEKPAKLRRGITMDDETVMLEPDAFRIRRKGKVVPFSGRNNWLDNELDGRTVAGALGEPTVSAERTLAPEKTMVPTQQNATLESTGNAGGEDPEIARLQEYLRLNERKMNALEIVEVKEKIAALRRARDLIDWERGHKGRMQVKGDVRRENNANTEVADAATMVAGNEPAVTTPIASPVTGPMTARVRSFNASESTVQTPLDASDEPTLAMKPGAGASAASTAAEINAEDLLGGDGAAVDNTSSGVDDTFTPVVYGADDSDDVDSAESTMGGDIGTFVPGANAGVQAASIPVPDPTEQYDEYKVPSISEILNDHEAQTADYTEDELNAIGKMLEEKLENFKVKGRVIGCETGPMITRFEVEPGPGVKVSRFTSLQEDLAMPLRVSSVRILAPIPGKAAVGIEIPNRKFQTVYSKDVFESEKFAPSPEKIMVALGKDITGEAFSMDLAKAPHLLIAGQTGSGKSVCINALMASMLFSKTPDELRMILVDPKAVELKMYENIPHLLAPVITKPEIAIQALQWLCYEMDRRTEVLATAKVRNIGGFNAKYEAGELPDDIPAEDKGHRMPFIVVIIDEMADLMMVAGKEIEKSVARLAAKARAVGIHLVLATQRPSVKVITGIIKANLPTRISFKVASQIDARTVMDHAGAEKLLGRGDMLFKAVNDPDPVRVHGAFLSDEEAERLADACSNQNVYYPQVESFDVSEGVDGEENDGEGGAKKLGKLDPLLFEVACWAVEVSGLSTSAVQRHFSVGYSRAGKIVDQLYGLGVCGPSKGNSKPRAMLVGMDELMQLERSGTFR
ncbi:MAG: DNA translocase FtsK [Fibrobacter sp.]|nr:DNA translocase FtsK [Fibrobacter sp.]